MKLIPETKCRRCGQSFSSLQNKCPNCGTRRVGQSGRTPAPTPATVDGTDARARNDANMKWQMIFGGILVVAVILSVIVMVSTSLSGKSSSVIKTTPSPTPVSVAATPVVEAPPTPTPTPMPTLEKLNITYYGVAKEDITMRVGDDPLPLAAGWTPADITGRVTWKSSDPSVLKVTVDSTDPNKCTIECVASSTTPVKLSLTLYGTTVECVVRCVG